MVINPNAFVFHTFSLCWPILAQESDENIENIENIEILDQEPGAPEVQESDHELSVEFLEALGEPSDGQKQYSNSINSNILQRFENILIEGMKKEEKEGILKQLSIPENGKLMEAPKLNIELTSLLSSAMRLRDKMLEERQDDTGYAIAAICQAIDMMSRPNFDVMTIIKNLSDATRLLCHLHYKYTDIRRKLISPLLDKNLNLNLKDNKRSEWLYTKLDDTVKSVSALKKASSVLAAPKPKPPKNWQPPRQPFHYHRGRGTVRGGYQQQQRYQARLPQRQNQHQTRRPPLGPSASRETSRGRARYP